MLLIDDGERLWWEYSGADGNQNVVEVLGEGLKLSRDRLRSFMVAGEGSWRPNFSRSRCYAMRGAYNSRSSWSNTR